ncbi:ABC transporter permease [Erysipelothrix piscisicarius]|uniref:ABC transporter permease n=1 Tax=Erysipelothrix piscisicarius TaxID=2485784 RepID=UPI002F949BA6
MLGILMAFFGPTKKTVIIGLVLYSLLPVVLNTVTGLESVDPGIREAAQGMGMTKIQRLFKVELPIAFPFIFSGMRIAVVTSVGVAVFGALVGGGGLSSIYTAVSVHKI